MHSAMQTLDQHGKPSMRQLLAAACACLSGHSPNSPAKRQHLQQDMHLLAVLRPVFSFWKQNLVAACKVVI